MNKKKYNSKVSEDCNLILAEKLKGEFFSLQKSKRGDIIEKYLRLIENNSEAREGLYGYNVSLEINSYKLFEYVLNGGLDYCVVDFLLDDFHRLVYAKNNNEPIQYSNNVSYKDIKEKYNTIDFDGLLDKPSINNLKSLEEIINVINLKSDIFNNLKEKFIEEYCMITIIVRYLSEENRVKSELPLDIEVFAEPMFSGLYCENSGDIEPYISADRIELPNLFFYIVANCIRNLDVNKASDQKVG